MDLVVALALVIGVTALIWLLLVLILWLHRPSRELAGPAMRLLPDVLRLIGRLLADPTTPRSVRAALLFLGAWLAFPIDLIPDFIPGLGQLDDLVVAAIVLRWVGRRLGPERIEASWPGTPQSYDLLLRLLRLPHVGEP
jgi:uncharacterized membrane protein YkvA (DUF1232 family)